MKKCKVFLIVFVCFFISTLFTITGVSAATYNGESGSLSYGGSSTSSCENGSWCNNQNFKAMSVTLYWIEADGDMKRVSGTKTIVVNDGSYNAPKQNCKNTIGCTKKEWFKEGEYGYNSDKISETIGNAEPGEVNNVKIKRMARWIAALYGQNKTFSSKEDAQNYVQKKIGKKNLEKSCVVDKANKNNQCKNKNGYRIVIEPVVGYDKNYKTGKLKQLAQRGIGENSVHNKEAFSKLMATEFKDVGIDYKKREQCTYADLAKRKNVNGCGWNIIDIGQMISDKANCEIKTTTKGTKKYYDSLGKNGKEREIKIIKNAQFSGENKYQIPSIPNENGYTLKEVKQYINNNCKANIKCAIKNNKCYNRVGSEVECTDEIKSWINTECMEDCWYDETTDTYYTDSSGDGKGIKTSLKRSVYNVTSSSNDWSGYSSISEAAAACATDYFNDGLAGKAEYSKRTEYPNGIRQCDTSKETSDCTRSSNTGSNVNCYMYYSDYYRGSCKTYTNKCIRYGSTCVKQGSCASKTCVKNTCSKTGCIKYNKKGTKCLQTGCTKTTCSQYQCTSYNCAEYNCLEYECKEYNWIPDWEHVHTYYFNTTWNNKVFDHNEYYISNQGWLTKSQADSWVNNNCKFTPSTCKIDTNNNGAWWDQNGNYHTSGLTKKVALWINKGCPVSRTKTTVTCNDCNSTNTDGGGYTISESKNWDQILGSYYGTNEEDETDEIENHFVKKENDVGDQVYCSESLEVKLPNGKTVDFNTAESGRFITVNLGDSYDDIMNLTPITVTKRKTCMAINNSEVTSSVATNIRNLSQLYSSSANALLKEYMEEAKEEADNSNDSDFGTIRLSYSGGTYDYNDNLDRYTEQSKLDGNTLTQVSKYVLEKDTYRYVSMKDGSSSKYTPNDLSDYYDLGISTLPVKFETPFTGTIQFVYDYEGTTFEDEFDSPSTWIDSSSQTCVNNIKNENYYTCEINNKGKKSSQNVCKIQKTDNGTKYYYNNKELSEKEYQKQCHCFEKDNKYYLNGSEISQDDYNQLCPAQCTTVCPAGEICCPVGGSDMPCSIDGICPTSGGNKLIYRTIDLKNPFTGQDTNKQGRNTGSNWCSYTIKTGTLDCSNLNDGVNSNTKKTSSSEKNKIVLKHIKNNAGAVEDDVYNQTPQYSITLDSQTIDNIRNYNENQQKSGGYDDFTLSCYNASSDQIRTNLRSNGIYTTNVCRSEFLRNNNIFSRSISGVCSNGGYDNLLTCSERSVK